MISPVISSQRSAERLTPSETPDAYSSAIVSAASVYPVMTLAPKYALVASGVILSCLVQPSVRSIAIRAPLEIRAVIAPKATSPTM